MQSANVFSVKIVFSLIHESFPLYGTCMYCSEFQRLYVYSPCGYMYMYMYTFFPNTHNPHTTHTHPQHGQLLAMEAEINKKIHRGDTGTDVGFYESLLQQLKAHMARVGVA